MKWIVIVATIALLVACSDTKRKQLAAVQQNPENGLVQEKHYGSFIIRCSYIPTGWNGAKDNTSHNILFRLNIQSSDPGVFKEKSNQQIASFGIDTLFQLVAGKDTLLPLYAERIANGNLGGAEYMVAFSPITTPQNLQLVFRDWIYSNTRLVFPLQPEKLHQSDSLSLAL